MTTDVKYSTLLKDDTKNTFLQVKKKLRGTSFITQIHSDYVIIHPNPSWTGKHNRCIDSLLLKSIKWNKNHKFLIAFSFKNGKFAPISTQTPPKPSKLLSLFTQIHFKKGKINLYFCSLELANTRKVKIINYQQCSESKWKILHPNALKSHPNQTKSGQFLLSMVYFFT